MKKILIPLLCCCIGSYASIDSISPDTVKWGQLINIYGADLGQISDSSTVYIGDSLPTVLTWNDTLIQLVTPLLDYGRIDTLSVCVGASCDMYTDDSLFIDGLWPNGVRTFYLLMSSYGNHSITGPPIGPHIYDSGTVVNIYDTARAFYGFHKWTRNNSVCTFGDSSLSATTIAIKGNVTVTAIDTIQIRYQYSIWNLVVGATTGRDSLILSGEWTVDSVRVDAGGDTLPYWLGLDSTTWALYVIDTIPDTCQFSLSMVADNSIGSDTSTVDIVVEGRRKAAIRRSPYIGIGNVAGR
jgi:hypothetical protein